jgi:hypothetical protein
VALDISNYLFNTFGTVFRQRGLKFTATPQGIGGQVSINFSGTGAAGSAFANRSNSDGTKQGSFADIFSTELSPVSNSNLLFVSEALNGGTSLAATRLIRLVGVWV